MVVSGYKRLQVYQDSFELALETCKATELFPRAEMHGLISQLRGSSRSIAANIAEGYGRRQYGKDFARFLVNAIGSLDETKVHLDFALAHGYIERQAHQILIDRYDKLGKQLSALIKSINKSP